MIRIVSRGNFKNTERFLKKMSEGDIFTSLEGYGQKGVTALSHATPVLTGRTAAAWDFEVKHEKGAWSITWTNGEIVDGVPLVILLQYGHGTGTGGYVQGRDFINPAIQPVFDNIADEVWEKVKSA